MPQPIVNLDGLARIEDHDADTFVAACELAGGRSYMHYFPFLYFYGSDGRLRWERHGASILIYQIRRRKAEGARMSLYLPPTPFDDAALRHALERIHQFNKSRAARIIWVAEEEALKIARAGFSISFERDEFIFDRTAVMKLEGSSFSKLRQELSRALRTSHLETRPYRAEDEPACLAVLENWEKRQATAGIKTIRGHAKRACLAGAGRFTHPLLSGLLVEIDSIVRGFAFGGRISSELGCTYLCHTDIGFSGIPHLLRYRLMEAYPEFPYFNDGAGGKSEGLQDFKRWFRPVEMHGRYSAQMR